MFKLTETEWRTKFTLYFKEIRKLKFTMPFHSECRKAKSLIPSWLTRGSCGVLLGPVFRTISGFRGIFHFDLVRSGWA
jgi:hypothetical protein